MKTPQPAMGVAAALALAASAAASAASHGCLSGAEAERYIVASEKAWAASVATNDASVVKRILADDVVWVMDGEVIDKRAAIAGAEKGPWVVSNRLEYAHVRLFGDTALVQGSEAWKRKDGKTGRFVWTDTWLCRNGQWQIVAAEDVSVPASAAE